MNQLTIAIFEVLVTLVILQTLAAAAFLSLLHKKLSSWQ